MFLLSISASFVQSSVEFGPPIYREKQAKYCFIIIRSLSTFSAAFINRKTKFK